MALRTRISSDQYNVGASFEIIAIYVELLKIELDAY